ncbi:hypothetical protein BCR39DRAFT_516251 [Naematelia encephala]|uniref:Uncharacterized protein n=1 Tax=Naematelia encephala TaxID=71784 RepID=A0A1Y2BK83_9TREE|nr:hypothetical protein BCR39DRAFT_516251 [Naematelia encephala]
MSNVNMNVPESSVSAASDSSMEPTTPIPCTPEESLRPIKPHTTDSDIVSHFALPPLHAKSPSQPISISKPTTVPLPLALSSSSAANSPASFLLAPPHNLAPNSISSFGTSTVRPDPLRGLRAASCQNTLQAKTVMRLRELVNSVGSARTIIPRRVELNNEDEDDDRDQGQGQGQGIDGGIGMGLSRVDEMEVERCVFCGEEKPREQVELKDCGLDGWQWTCKGEC